jgi:hypothetical protein
MLVCPHISALELAMEKLSDLPLLPEAMTPSSVQRSPRPQPEGRNAAQRGQEESENIGLTEFPHPVNKQSCQCNSLHQNPKGQVQRAS